VFTGSRPSRRARDACERQQKAHILRLRGPFPKGNPKGRRAQRPAGRSGYPGQVLDPYFYMRGVHHAQIIKGPNPKLPATTGRLISTNDVAGLSLGGVPAWLRRVFAVPAAVAMLSFALVIVMPQLSSPVSAQAPPCSAKVTAAPTALPPYRRRQAPMAGCWSSARVSTRAALSTCSRPTSCTRSRPARPRSPAPMPLIMLSKLLVTPCSGRRLLTDGAPIAGAGSTPPSSDSDPHRRPSGKSVQQVTYGAYRSTG